MKNVLILYNACFFFLRYSMKTKCMVKKVVGSEQIMYPAVVEIDSCEYFVDTRIYYNRDYILTKFLKISM